MGILSNRIMHDVVGRSAFSDHKDFKNKPKLNARKLPLMEKFSIAEQLVFNHNEMSNKEIRSLLETPALPGKRAIGKGEFMMKTLLNGEASLSSDFLAQNLRWEIKFGMGRLRGMSGFGSSFLAAQEMDESFNITDKTDANRWNFYNGKTKKKMLLARVLKEQDPTHVIKKYAKALKKIFIGMTDVERRILAFELEKELNGDKLIHRYGNLNFTYKVCAFALKYYQNIEKFERIAFLNDKLECLIMDDSFIRNSTIENLATFIRYNFEMTPMSFSHKAGPQGSSFGLRLK